VCFDRNSNVDFACALFKGWLKSFDTPQNKLFPPAANFHDIVGLGRDKTQSQEHMMVLDLGFVSSQTDLAPETDSPRRECYIKGGAKVSVRFKIQPARLGLPISGTMFITGSLAGTEVVVVESIRGSS
jgi:hypothetical protein